MHRQLGVGVIFDTVKVAAGVVLPASREIFKSQTILNGDHQPSAGL